MSMREKQDHSEARGYRYYVFVDADRGRGFDDEASALMHYDEEIVLAQRAANGDQAPYEVSVRDEMSAGKDAIVAMHTCQPEAKSVFTRNRFLRLGPSGALPKKGRA